jgi:hypothetical protein
MNWRAPALAGAVTLFCLAACSSHVDVGLSRDAAAPSRSDAGDAGGRADAGATESGVTHTEPSAEPKRWARVRKP